MAKKLVGADHFARFVNLGGLMKQGREILFTKNTVAEGAYKTDLWVFDTAAKRSKQLTDGIEIGSYRWEDGGKVIFTAVIEAADKALQEKQIPITCFYRLDTATGAREFLFRVRKNVSAFEKIQDNRWFFLCSDNLHDDLYLEQAGGDWEKFAQRKQEEADYLVAEEVPYWTNSAGYCDGKRGRVFSYKDGQLAQISPDDLHVTGMKAYQDKYVAYFGVKSGGVQNTTGRLYRYDLQREVLEPLDTSEEYIYTYLEPVSETELLLCRSDRKLHGEYQDEFIDLYRMDDGTYLRKNETCDYHLYDNVVSDASYLSTWLNKPVRAEHGTYFIALDRESSRVFYWDDGKDLPEAISAPGGKVIDYEIAGGELYLIAMRGLGGTELYVQPISGGPEIRLTEENTHLEEAYQYSAVEYLPFVNNQGVEIQGWYIKPAHFKEGEKYPAILFIHGGPQCAFGTIFNHDMQLAAARGFGVLFCNPTGSEGRGGDFGDLRMKYGTIDYDDLIGFTTYAAEQLPWIDRENLGVTGGSYGGIMTNWIIGHTDLFRAAVSDRGVSNNISDFGLSDIGVSFGLDTFETTPWGDIAFLWDQSPLKYAEHIKTPTLFIHGAEDYRCPHDHALQMHTALTYFGTPSKVILFKGENHELCRSGQPKHRIRRLEETMKWFETHLARNPSSVES